jgi:ERCC4-type nuclease
MSSIILTIDHREKDLKIAFPNAEYLNLDLGDIKITYNGNLVLLIERKTMNDLIASVNDGRYREQKKRLLDSGIPQSKIMYILEGSLNDIPGHLKTLYGMIINTLFRDKLTVLKFFLQKMKLVNAIKMFLIIIRLKMERRDLVKVKW